MKLQLDGYHLGNHSFIDTHARKRCFRLKRYNGIMVLDITTDIYLFENIQQCNQL